MSNPIVLDSGLLGMIVHPRQNQELAQWFREIMAARMDVILAEIADYELRRELLHRNFTPSLTRLDGLKQTLVYLPLNTETMLRAAFLWAEARKQGFPTAHPKALDGDVILAAQALSVSGIVVTENVKHLSHFVSAKRWREISPERFYDL